MLRDLLNVALIAFGAFALLHPASPFTLAMLRHRGPRRDHSRLLRAEIHESARGFASLALLSLLAMGVLLLVVRDIAPRSDSEKLPYYVGVLTLGGVGAFFAFEALRSSLAAWLRGAEREEALLRARLPEDAPRELSGASLVSWAMGREIRTPAAAPPQAASVEQILEYRLPPVLLALGVAFLLAGVALLWRTLAGGFPHAGSDERNELVIQSCVSLAGVALVGLAWRLDRASTRAGE